MEKAFFNAPISVNEPIKSYVPGSPEHDVVLKTYKSMFYSQIDVPIYINGKNIC